MKSGSQADKVFRFIQNELAAGRTFPSRKRLATLNGQGNLKAVDDALLTLVADGYLQRDRSAPGTKYTYTLKELV